MKSSASTLQISFTLVISLLGAAAAAPATTYTVDPAADAFVYEGTPATNYGLDPFLLIRNPATGQGIHSFLRFNLPILDGNVLSATLRLRVTGSINEVGYYRVTMGYPSWPETWITWNNWQSGSAFTYLGSHYSVPANTYLYLDVTHQVGSSPVTFALASSADVPGQHFYSRDNLMSSVYDPELTIVTDGPTLPGCGATTETPGDPADLLNELLCVMQGGTPVQPNWHLELDPNFNQWSGGTQNRPVIAAAAALFADADYVVNGTDYRAWWIDFLNRQATSPSSTQTGLSYYFKGSELFSNVYDAATVTGVMGAHYWAQTHSSGPSLDPNAAPIQSRARDYLRRTWYAYGLTASPPDFDAVYDVRGSTRTLVKANNENCPVLAMASSRSKADFTQDSRRWLLRKVIGIGSNCYKSPHVRDAVQYMEAQYASVYGLTSSEINEIRALVTNTSMPSSISSILGAVRMKTDFHFLLWSNGRRATYYLGSQLNNNVNVSGGKGTVYTAIYDRSTRDLELLFELGKSTQSCLDSSARRIYVDDLSTPGCGSSHWIPLPVSNPDHHFVLGPGGWKSCSNLACD